MDINLLRDPATIKIVRESQQKRYASTGLVDMVIALDKTAKELRTAVNKLRTELNAIQKAIGAKKKAKQAVTKEDLEKNTELKSRVAVEDKIASDAEALRDQYLFQIGNLVHESVPVSKDEHFNKVEREWGTCRKTTPELLHHHKLLYKIGGYEPVAGAKVAGHRGYFLKGAAVLLNQALINYSMKMLNDKKYVTMHTPFFMRKSVMAKTAQLSDFDEQLYKVSGSDGVEDTTDKYLIATSEQPISAVHSDEWLPEKSLPIKYCGYSTNFRKEAGGHGRDVWGIFRVHQFEKVEQFCITKPEDSWAMHEEMILNSEEFYKSLGLPYRVVTIVSGELNDAAAKKYDLEGWFPALGEFKELVSCSNCTDYQSRRLEIRCGFKKKDETSKKYVHMLNSTMCATSRTICAILENHQTETGITVPEVLRPYMHGMTEIPFVREIPKSLFTVEKKKKGKGKKK